MKSQTTRNSNKIYFKSMSNEDHGNVLLNNVDKELVVVQKNSKNSSTSSKRSKNDKGKLEMLCFKTFGKRWFGIVKFCITASFICGTTLFYYLYEGWPVLDCFYFVIVSGYFFCNIYM